MAPESESGRDLGDVLNAVEKATASLVAKREDADARVRESIALVEKCLVQALRGEALRGLPDLGGRIYGLRVGVEGSSFAKLPIGRACLVLEAKGLLVLATIRTASSGFVQRAPPHFLRASILVPYVRVVRAALSDHVRAASERRVEFGRIGELSDILVRTLRDARFSSPPAT